MKDQKKLAQQLRPNQSLPAGVVGSRKKSSTSHAKGGWCLRHSLTEPPVENLAARIFYKELAVRRRFMSLPLAKSLAV